MVTDPHLTRPAAVAFDVDETLFRCESLRGHLVALGLPALALEWWLAVVLRDGFARDAAGNATPFQALALEALHDAGATAGIVCDHASTADVLAGIEELDAHDDVVRALLALERADVAAVALTNRASRDLGALVARADMEGVFAHLVSGE